MSQSFLVITELLNKFHWKVSNEELSLQSFTSSGITESQKK